MVLGKKATTIQDVARHAKVSAATVSRVLSTPERVSEAARERVQAAIRETGYTLNQAARTLRLQRAKTILTAMPGIGNPFYSTILEAVIETAARRGYAVLTSSRLGVDPGRWLNDYLVSNRADGLLIFDGSLNTPALHHLTEDDAPVPLVAAYDELPDPRINSVITDNRAAARRAVRYLLDNGHRRIVHVAGPSRNASPNERALGFHEAMTAARLKVPADWVIQGDYSMPSGEAAADRVLAMKIRPTAAFIANDEMAIGFIARLRERGYDCPRDISIIAFDDITVSRAFAPPLTTMRQPREDIGRIATETLIDIIEGSRAGKGPVHVVLTSELVERSSVMRVAADSVPDKPDLVS
jgi:LacI family repressor for deo operon, udp, cdd, tsx, nupC, and nupG